MEGRGADARIVGAAAFASMEGARLNAGIAGAAAFASMEGRGANARIAGAAAFASMEGAGANARNVGALPRQEVIREKRWPAAKSEAPFPRSLWLQRLRAAEAKAKALIKFARTSEMHDSGGRLTCGRGSSIASAGASAAPHARLGQALAPRRPNFRCCLC